VSFQIDCGFKEFHSAGSYQRVILSVGDMMGKHPYIELGTLRVYVYVYYGQVDKEMDFHTTKIDKPFGVRFHF
jgi:hypothetical protein